MKLLEIAESLGTLTLALVGLFATILYSQKSNKREEDRVMKELFTYGNKRYSELNEKLEEAANSTDIESLGSDVRAAVIDYFNLCAEQYFWYKKGRIDEVVWTSWSAGMNFWYKHKTIKELWLEETSSREGTISYYITNGDEFFKD